MVRIRLLRGQAVARLRGLRATGFGSLLVTVILVASLSGLGGGVDGLGGDESSSAESPAPLASAATRARAATAEKATEAESVRALPPTAPSRERLGSHPSNLLQLPASADSAVVFDLQANRMHLFSTDGERTSQVGEFFVAVGKNGIEKSREGDEKTPVGIYFVSSYISGKRLPAIYGAGAFPINYPNAWDRRLGRTGSGIWIHGTDKDDASLLPQSSRGCLTLHNTDFQATAELLRIRHTPVIVTEEVSWTSPKQLEAERAGLAAAVEAWRGDWESLDTEAYLEHYSQSFRTDSMDLATWIAHKRRVNASKSYIEIGVGEVGIYSYPGEPELFLVTFEQTYRSSNFQGRRWKHQYWRREAGDWRIVHEGGT